MHTDVPPVGTFRFGRTLRAALLVTSLLGGQAFLQAENQIIYPRAAAPAEVPATTPASGSNVSVLIFALAAAAAGGWLLWRQRQSQQGLTARDARKLAIAETRSLGNRQYLVVADYDGKKFLLGVCPGRIDLLAPLDGANPPSPAGQTVGK